MSGIRTSGEGFTRSLSFNGFKMMGDGMPNSDLSIGFSGFQVITEAQVAAFVRKEGKGKLKESDHLTDDGTETGGVITFAAGYIDLGPYERIVVSSGIIKAFRG